MTDNNLNCIKQSDDGMFLFVKLTPNSSRNEILGYTDDYIKIKISAPPNENKANKKLVEFLSSYLKIPKSGIEIVSGDKSRIKKLLIKNITEDVLSQKIYIYDKIEA